MRAVLVLALCGGLSYSADPTIDGKKAADYLVELKVKDVQPGTAIIWDFYEKESGRRLGQKKVIPISRECVFAGPKGKYEVLVRLVKGEDVQELTYEVELLAGVAPTPPAPPGPPTPADPLAASLAAVYKADTSATKADDVAKLAAVFRQLVAQAVDDPSITTRAALIDVAHRSAEARVPLPKLAALRNAIADELDAKAGKTAVTLTPEIRTAYREQYARMAALLEALK